MLSVEPPRQSLPFSPPGAGGSGDPPAETSRSLAELRAAHPLPASLENLETFEETVIVAGVRIHGCGLAARHAGGETLTGAAADLHEIPYARSYFELLERTAAEDAAAGGYRRCAARTLDGAFAPFCAPIETTAAGPGLRWSTSSGTAMGPDWRSACAAAARELVERDRLLRSWYGSVRPERRPLPHGALPRALDAHYELEAYSLPAAPGALAPPELGPCAVVAVFGFPRRPEDPLVQGCAARATDHEAIAAAARELLQQLAFGWGEPVPEAAPEPAPVPVFHLDYYAYPPHHPRLRAWLDGAHHGRGPALPCETGPFTFLDLTPAEPCGGLRVARASHPGALPLAFGTGHPWLAEVPETMRVHPIA